LITAVSRLIKQAKEDIKEMGQTGAGIASEDEIRPGTSFTTKWGVFQHLLWVVEMLNHDKILSRQTHPGSSTCGP
jgi:hypothetical protein